MGRLHQRRDLGDKLRPRYGCGLLFQQLDCRGLLRVPPGGGACRGRGWADPGLPSRQQCSQRGHHATVPLLLRGRLVRGGHGVSPGLRALLQLWPEHCHDCSTRNGHREHLPRWQSSTGNRYIHERATRGRGLGAALERWLGFARHAGRREVACLGGLLQGSMVAGPGEVWALGRHGDGVRRGGQGLAPIGRCWRSCGGAASGDEAICRSGGGAWGITAAVVVFRLRAFGSWCAHSNLGHMLRRICAAAARALGGRRRAGPW